ncbi:MAG: GNAT family N-acetyltransferase [Dehalococcoidales bacterium]|nr:GNAT family N-acetyltransferase [Dehalococcoidales bacterium]
MITGSKIVLRDKRLADALNDYTWQADPELAWLDAAPPLSLTFQEYLPDYTSQIHYISSSRRQFAIETPEGRHIGNCVYYGIDEVKSEAELGIMIGDREYWGKGYGADAIAALLNYIFQTTRLRRVHLKTLETNLRAQKCFRKCGFTPCGHIVRDGFALMVMEISRRRWQTRQTTTPPPSTTSA